MILRMAVVLIAVLGATQGDEEPGDRDFRRVSALLPRVNQLMLTYRGEDREAKLTQLREAAERLHAVAESLAALEKEMKAELKSKFKDLPKIDPLNVKAAIRGRAFLPEFPKTLLLTRQEDRITISKPQGTEIYHLCPDVALEGEFRLLIRFSLKVQSFRGGTPVPYFGFRSPGGSEDVLWGFSSAPDPKKVQEILIERTGSATTILVDGDIVRPLMVPQHLSEQAYPFFHMNDRSEIEIYEVRAWTKKAKND